MANLFQQALCPFAARDLLEQLLVNGGTFSLPGRGFPIPQASLLSQSSHARGVAALRLMNRQECNPKCVGVHPGYEFHNFQGEGLVEMRFKALDGNCTTRLQNLEFVSQF